MVCDICRNVDSSDLDETSEENKKVQCAICKIEVHQNCYGIPNDGICDEWMCKVCDAGIVNKYCELCPSTTGALTTTTKGKFVHVICALFTTRADIEDLENVALVNIDNIAKKNFGVKCYVCQNEGRNEAVGACVKCAEVNCKRYSHVTCAQEQETLREIETKSGLVFRLYCSAHIGKSQLKMSSSRIRNNLQVRRSIGLKTSAKNRNLSWVVDSTKAVSAFVFHLKLILNMCCVVSMMISQSYDFNRSRRLQMNTILIFSTPIYN